MIKKIIMKVHKLVFSPISVNTYILDDKRGNCAIIDCGCYNEDEFQILKYFLRERVLTPKLLLNTHLHLDHIFGNRRVYENYGLMTHAAAEEEENRKSAQKHAMMFGLNMEEPPEIGEIIKGGQVIDFEGIKIETIFVPGHTAGSMAFYIEKEHIVFTGDALFAGSIGRTDLPGGDYNTLIKSIKEGLLCLDGETVIYPGHGKESTILNEKENNPYID